MISAITDAVLIKAAENSQPDKLPVILLSTAIFIAASAVSAVLTYRLKKKKYREENESIRDGVKEQENDF